MVVRQIDPAMRRIVIGPRQASSRHVRLRDPNWLIDQPAAPFRAQVKLRARETPQPALVTASGLVLDEPALAAPGQAAVVYQGSRILGGGFIIA
jgi:tRNA-specific 2-thiouridylase